MSNLTLENRTVAELSAGLKAKKYSSVELTQTFLQRIKTLQPQLNPFVTVDEAGALHAAEKADALRSTTTNVDDIHPLCGVPIAHKDLFMTKGLRTTCSSRMLENYVAPYDAHIVSQLRGTGAVTLGKTAMDEFAMGSSTETSYFGVVRNPWNTDYVPGGSSGGSAVAVAARMAPAATGSDTGGSIRQPAAFNGITGIKPTYGICSRYGMIAFASSLDQAGVFAQTAEDCATILTVMAGHDPRDATSLRGKAENYSAALTEKVEGQPLKGLRIGLPKEFFADGVDADVINAVQSALDEYRKLGAETVDISLANIGYSVPTYYVIAPAEASSNLSRFDGVRYGHRAKDYKDLTDMYRKTRAEGFGEEVKRRILIGTYVLSHGYYDAYYLKAQKVRHLIADDFKAAFEKCDVIMGATVPETAFKLGDQLNDPIKMYLNDIFTIGANLAGLPAMSIPCGFDRHGLPIGLQLQGNYFSEGKLLNIAHRFQQATDWHRKTPTMHAKD
jgi:aspartyl-tRNA(Asn)/glutamyl-tRNA(Gln) amidotransferase subunit A